MTRTTMYSPPLEHPVTFPVVPNIMYSSPNRHVVPGLYIPLRPLGEAAISGMESTDRGIRNRAEGALEFLIGITRFIGNSPPKRTLKPGRHAFVCDLSQDRGMGLEVARAHADLHSGPQPEHPVSNIVAEYSIEDEVTPVSNVSVYMDIEGHPHLEAQYARLSGTMSSNQGEWTLRAAIGHISYRGRLVPDDFASFGALEYIGLKLGQLESRPA